MLPYNKRLKNLARQLRKNLTRTEGILWSRLRRKQLYGCQFYRQKNVGDFIVDFYCPRARLVVELDGGQHFSSEGEREDWKREQFLAGLGLTVLRFANLEVLRNLNKVLDTIGNNVVKNMGSMVSEDRKKSPPAPL